MGKIVDTRPERELIEKYGKPPFDDSITCYREDWKMSKKDKELNSNTPRWFVEWHLGKFLPVKNKTSWNTKLIYIILAAIIGSSVFDGEIAQAASALSKLISG